MIGRLLQRTVLSDWRAITGVFFTAYLLESLALGHLDAFTPLFLRDELGLPVEEVRVWTGLTTAAMFSVAFPLAPLWGSLAERYSRKAVIVRSQYIEALGYLMVAFSPNLAWFFVARLVLGFTFGNIAVLTATQTLLTPERKMASAISTVQAASPIALSLGPLFGGFLLPVIGLRNLFLIDAAGCLVAALLVTFLSPEPRRTGARKSVAANLKGAVGTVWQRPELRWNFACWYLTRGAVQVIGSYLPVRITELVPNDPGRAIGFVLGGFGVLTSISTWAAGRIADRYGAARVYWPSMIVAAVASVGAALAPALWMLAAFAWARALPVAMTNTVLYAHLAQVLRRDERVPVMTLTPVPRNFAAFSLPLFAAAAANASVSAALLVAAAAYGLAALAGWRLLVETPPALLAEAAADHASDRTD